MRPLFLAVCFKSYMVVMYCVEGIPDMLSITERSVFLQLNLEHLFMSAELSVSATSFA